MAGLFPDVPDHRIAYHKDGTILLINNVQQSAGTLAAWNKDGGGVALSASNSSTYTICWLFPEPYDLSHAFMAYYDSMTDAMVQWSWSDDTTNGSDGTWNSIANFATRDTSNAMPKSRTNIQTINLTAVKGIRFYKSYSALSSQDGLFVCCHFYGTVVSATSDRLDIWDASLDQKLGPAALDWGDFARKITEDRTFRVKNTSDSYTANSVVVSVEAVTNATPTQVDSFSLSLDGTNFSSTVDVGNLGPGAISAVVTIRKSAPDNAQLYLYNSQLVAVATDWV